MSQQDFYNITFTRLPLFPNSENKQKTFNHFKLLIFGKEDFLIKQAKKEYIIQKNSLFLLKKNEYCEISSIKKRENDIGVLSFDSSFKLSEFPSQPLPISPLCMRLLNKIYSNLNTIQLIKKHKPSMTNDVPIGVYYQTIESFTSQLFSVVLSATEEEFLKEKLPKDYRAKIAQFDKQLENDILFVPNENIVENNSTHRIEMIITFLEKNVNQNLTIEEIAHHFFISPSTLKKDFKKVTGQTIMYYFRTKKIDQAKILIKEGKMSITEISIALGFRSIHQFSATFKTVAGCSPTIYRKKLQ